MIQFNDLKFLTSKTLLVNAEVIDLEYFANVYIESIVIDTEDTVLSTGPSQNPPYTYTLPVRSKSFNKMLDVSDLVKDGPKMLFVYVKCTGCPSANTPCGMDSEYSMKAVVNYACIYKEGLKRAKCVGSCGCVDGNCAIDTAFANFALQYFRLTTALENDDIETAYDAWYYLNHRGGPKRLTLNSVTSKPCSCNG